MLFKAKEKILRICFFLSLLFVPAYGSEFADQEAAEYEKIVENQVVVYYQPPDSKVAREYLTWSTEFVPHPDFLRKAGLKKLAVYIAPTNQEFTRLTGGRLPEWGVACALPQEDAVIVRSPRIVPLWKENPREILLHEIAHVFLEQQLSPAEIPRWFHEGFAVYSSSMWGIESSLEFSVALLVGAVAPMKALSRDFPADEVAARRAYLQSYTLIEYMFGNWQDQQLALLFQKWREQGELDKALRISLGLTLMQLENRWRKWVEVRYGWLKLLTSVTVIWIFAAGLFIAVYISRRLKFKKKLKEMKLQEIKVLEEQWLQGEDTAGGQEMQCFREEEEPDKPPGQPGSV
ncbi:MAG TPA: hypothetical protein VM123_12290 [archaeon]|nr:hypothetical protein [archaeon]